MDEVQDSFCNQDDTPVPIVCFRVGEVGEEFSW